MDNPPNIPSRTIPAGMESPDDIAVFLRDHLDVHAIATHKRRYGLNREDLADILADVFGKMLAYLRGGKRPNAPVAWANTVLENAIKDHLKQKQSRKAHHAAVRHQLNLEFEARSHVSPIDAVNQNAALGRAMDGLRTNHPAQAQALTLQMAGNTVPEVAEALGVSLSNAKQLVSRGRKRLHDHLRTEALLYLNQGKDIGMIAAELGVPISIVTNELLQDKIIVENEHHRPAVGDA